MMNRNRVIAWVIATVGVVGGTATASMSVSIESNPSGEFHVFLSAGDDNYGIASYSIPLLGDILSVDHNSPNGVVKAADGAISNIGFSLVLRSLDNSPHLFASQDTLTNSPFLVSGFGQMAGNLGEFGTILAAEQARYDASLLVASGKWDPNGNKPTVNFESAEVGGNLFSDESLLGVEPADLQPVSGDLDRDGNVDADDIDHLCENLGSSVPSLDLDSNNRVDTGDLDLLLRDELLTVYGDSNLDGTFNSSDFIAVFQAAEYEDDIAGNSRWGTGDWNCDQEFDTSDFLVAFKAGGFRRAAYPVPESRAWSLIVVITAVMIRRRASHRKIR